MRAGRAEGDQRVTVADLGAVDDFVFFDYADAKTGDIVVFTFIHAGHFSGFAAGQGTAGQDTAFADAGDDLGSDFDIEFAGSVVIQEEQGLGAGNDEIVDTHTDQIDTDTLMAAKIHGQAQLGADTVSAGDQYGFFVSLGQFTQGAKTAQVAGGIRALSVDELEQAKRYQHNFSVIIVDIDHFKQINDNFGHQVGDLVLKGFSEQIAQCIRKTDTFGRWGGEEFVIICPQSDQQQTKVLAEKLRTRILEYKFEGLDQISASFGVASYQRDDQAKDLIARADTAMYDAKRNGRNQVCVQ